jgi:predicted MFS family arabinose efflux permease
MTDFAAAAPPRHAPLQGAYRRYALCVLLAIYSLNFLDRQIVTILAEPIRNDLGLLDWQLGMMTGFAFALLYTVMGIPIARYAERANRPYIIAGATAVWSLFTIACGYAQNFTQLLLARVGVGVGEAGCTPPSHSLISDYVPPEKRASAIAFYHLGTPLGSLLGLVLGGVVAGIWGWRTAFLLAGAPGLLIALVALFTLREPRRLAPPVTVAGPTFGDALKELRGKRTFWLLAFAAAIVAFNGYGSAAFSGSFYLRNHAAELAQLSASMGLNPIAFLGIALGVLGGIAGMLGTWLGGVLADHYGTRDKRSIMTVPALAGLIAIPVYIVGLLVPSAVGAIVILTIPTLLASLWYGPVYGTVQGLVRPQTRATASAVLLFIVNLIGLGLGPLGVGVLSDVLANGFGLGPGDGLRWSLILFSLMGLVASALFWLARRTIREEMAS